MGRSFPLLLLALLIDLVCLLDLPLPILPGLIQQLPLGLAKGNARLKLMRCSTWSCVGVILPHWAGSIFRGLYRYFGTGRESVEVVGAVR